MAKMFYSAEEAAGKLGKSVDELIAMAKSGEVQSFKQDDQDMFRVEQIDMLAATDDDIGDLSISLDESGEADSMGLSGSAPGIDGDEASLEMSGEIGLEDSAAPGADDSFLAGSGMGTGISAFESESSGEDLLKDAASKMDLDLFGMIPFDENIAEYDLLGKPLTEIPADSPGFAALCEIVEKRVLR